MPNHKSSIKRVITDDKKRLRNRWHRGSMRSAVKSLTDAVEAGDLATAETLLPKVEAVVAHTRSRGVLHANTASRRISRLAKAVNRLRSEQAAS